MKKNVYSLFAIAICVLSTSCGSSKSAENSPDFLKVSELIGEWEQIKTTHASVFKFKISETTLSVSLSCYFDDGIKFEGEKFFDYSITLKEGLNFNLNEEINLIHGNTFRSCSKLVKATGLSFKAINSDQYRLITSDGSNVGTFIRVNK